MQSKYALLSCGKGIFWLIRISKKKIYSNSMPYEELQMIMDTPLAHYVNSPFAVQKQLAANNTFNDGVLHKGINSVPIIGC